MDNPDYEINTLSDDFLQRHSHLRKQILKGRDERAKEV